MGYWSCWSSSLVAVAAVSFQLLLLVLVLVNNNNVCDAGITSRYERKLEESLDMPFDSDVFRVPPGYNAPQQVHIMQGDQEGRAMIVSWVTADEAGSNTVVYWDAKYPRIKYRVQGTVTRYNFYNYTSGFIHHTTLDDLFHDTLYYYTVGIGHTNRTFHFTTPPPVGPDVPYTFGLIGDIGQTFDSNSTLTHYENNPAKGQAVIFVGDMSYADEHPNNDNVKYDTWGRFMERSNAYQPWIWTPGNHDIDFAPELGELEPFKVYTHRYPVPHRAADSSSPLWYSVKRASAHIIVLSSYSACAKYTPQYIWLKAELEKVDREKTPWLFVVTHSPLYNSYGYHYMEAETMRVVYEPWFVKYKVDIVFSGHVHAYERSLTVEISSSIDGSHYNTIQERISNIAYNITNKECSPVKDQSAPVYITIGDGGNLEGLTTKMTYPQPSYSAFREASFGHAILQIKNRTHAYYSWHRNHDGFSVKADSMWFYNRYWNPVPEPTS